MCRFVDGFGSWLEKEMEEKCSFHSHFLPALAQCHAISWTLFFFSSLLVFVCVFGYSQLCSTLPLPLPLPWSMSWHWCTTKTTDNKVVCSFVSVWQGAPQAGFTHSLTHSLIFFNFILPTGHTCSGQFGLAWSEAMRSCGGGGDGGKMTVKAKKERGGGGKGSGRRRQCQFIQW